MKGRKSNIVLIGMPGSGKTTVGRALAEALGAPFVDCDDLIRAREGKSLEQIIEERGTDGFLALEEEVNARLSAENCVIAPGGSVVYGKRAMAHLQEIGRIVYLRLPCTEIERRLSDPKGRGVAMKEGYTLKDLYEERTPLYEKYADIAVDAEGKDVAETVRILTERMEK